MKKRVENYIPRALTAITDKGINDGDKVDSQYNSYIASLGASIRQAGLLATVLFYSNKNTQAEKDRYKVIDAIEYIIEEEISITQASSSQTKKKVIDAATALKLAIRTYEKVKED